MSFVVIGSGLSAYAAILGLVDRGIKPTVIDIALESNESMQRYTNTSKSILAKKTLFESDHMYKYPLLDLDIQIMENSKINYHLTGALGGMSSVWGAGLQPLDLSTASKIPQDLQNNFYLAQIALLKKIPHSFVLDDLNIKYKWPIDDLSGTSIYTSRFFENMLKKYSRKKNRMGELLIGHPRLAVNQFDPENGCILCGKCLEGCPQGSILNSGNEIKKLNLAGKIDFIKGVVTSLKILESKMTEISYKTDSGEIKTINASHLFLGLGPIATPALLLKSDLITGPVKVKDSQVFYVMFLRLLSFNRKQKFSLAQLVVTNNINQQVTSSENLNDFNLSLFEYSNNWDSRLESMLKQINMDYRIFKSLGKFLLKFLVSGIGFISTEDSGHILIEKDKLNNINISGQVSEDTKLKLTRYQSFIRKKLRLLGLIPVPTNLNKEPILGAGWHLGSGLPMGDCQYIDWGSRLHKTSNIYVIDATSLPEIKPGSHTFSAMINAYRVAISMNK
jgi:hypothetical protein